MAGITKKLRSFWSLQKTKMKTKTNGMGVLILKKACSIIKVFVVATIIKTIIMTRANSNKNDNNNNNNNKNSNSNNNNNNNNNNNSNNK